MTVLNFQDLFELGMKRRPPELLTCGGPAFDCGSSGKFKVPGAVALGKPDWEFPRDKIPADDDTVGTIHAYHFLEHLKGEDVVLFLREVERVLTPERGVMNFSMPYYNTTLMAGTLDHKSLWCEDTFDKLFTDDSWENFGKWKLQVHFLMIAGIVQRNLCVIGQLVKSNRPRGRWREEWSHPALD